jgi:hypothetical protein
MYLQVGKALQTVKRFIRKSGQQSISLEAPKSNNTIHLDISLCGPGSSVRIETGYGLDGPGIESWWGARFSAPVQTVPGAHPSSCTMGTGSFPGVECGWGVTLTPQPLLVSRSKNRVWLYLYSF